MNLKFYNDLLYMTLTVLTIIWAIYMMNKSHQKQLTSSEIIILSLPLILVDGFILLFELAKHLI